jgi:hypothetical protein
MNDVAQSIHRRSVDLLRRAQELEDIIQKRKADQRTMSRLKILRDQISKYGIVGSIVMKFSSRSRFIDKYTVAFEVTLPCLLVAALLALVIYGASKMIFLETV